MNLDFSVHFLLESNLIIKCRLLLFQGLINYLDIDMLFRKLIRQGLDFSNYKSGPEQILVRRACSIYWDETRHFSHSTQVE